MLAPDIIKTPYQLPNGDWLVFLWRAEQEPQLVRHIQGLVDDPGCKLDCDDEFHLCEAIRLRRHVAGAVS